MAQASQGRPTHRDVIVVGGGSAGVAAAIGAAREGARTLLLERAGCLGGASTLRNVLTYCGLYTLGEAPRPAVAGIAAAVMARLRAMGAVVGPRRHRGVFVVFDPEAVKLVLDALCAEAGVEVRLHAMVTGAARDDGEISAVTVHDHAGRHEFAASAFVDASGEADLAHFGSAATRYGNNGAVNLGTLGTRFGGIPPEVSVSADQFTAAIQAARAAGIGPLSKDRSVVTRLPISHDLVCYLASEDYDPRDAAALSRAEAGGRAQAWRYLDILRSLPGCGRAYLVATGPEFGTRESRHIESVRPLAWADVAAGTRFADCIALGAWGAEWHDRATLASSFALPPSGGAYDIPLRCLTSRDTPNLFAAGRTIDGDRQAGASLRVMGTAFATGEAAGIAAAEYAAHGVADPDAVRKSLSRHGALLHAESLPPEVVID